MREYHVVYITDQNYAMPTCVSIISLKENRIGSASYRIHVLAAEVLSEDQEKMASLSTEDFHVEVMELDNEITKSLGNTGMSKKTYVTATAMYKFFVANILSDVDQVLYLDGDIIINKDLSDLFEIDLTDMYLAAVDDMGDEYTDNGYSKMAVRIGLYGQMYFNSGVMLLNLKRMREDQIHRQLVKYKLDQTNYFMDQDALNYIMGSKRIRLPYQFNFRTALFNVMEIEEISSRFFNGEYLDISTCLASQTIIHMSDRLKPWKYNLPWITELFLYYYAKSPYQGKKINLLSPLKAILDHDGNTQRCKYFQSVIEKKVWKFPFRKIKRGSSIVLYGAGQVGHDWYEQITESAFCNVALWVDKYSQAKGKKVVCPEQIQYYEYDYVVIALRDKEAVKEIIKYLISLNVDQEKIVEMD